MKKMIFLAMLLIAVPAMAAVTVSCSGTGDTCTVSYVADGNNVRAFALDITVSDGNIVDASNLNADYYVHPGSVDVDGEGNISGDLVADDSYAGTLGGLGTGGITVEMASLYVGEANAPANGDLLSFQVDTGCTVSIAVNAIRGGVVMEDADEDPALSIVDGCVLAGPSCFGDIADTSGVGAPDGQVNVGDLNAMLIAMMGAYPTGDLTGIYLLPAGSFGGNADIADTSGVGAPDGQTNIGDLNALLIAMMGAYPTGDLTGIYLISCF